MNSVKEMLVILVGSSLVSNVVLSQFLGLCPFLGVSKKINTAAGMGGAVIFLITLSSAVAGCIYKFLLVPFELEYMQTIVCISLVPEPESMEIGIIWVWIHLQCVFREIWWEHTS